MKVTEELIHFIWKFRLLAPELETTLGEPVTILHPGQHNHDSGPDFFNARLRIGDTLWAGNVEIHIHASDWHLHGHSGDEAYDNTILHVVYVDDEKVIGRNGTPLPTLVVRDRFPAETIQRYGFLMEQKLKIPCSGFLEEYFPAEMPVWSPALGTERLNERTVALRQLWQGTDGNWEETAYQWIARGFGFKINSFPFELLARSLPLRVISRFRLSNLQTEALLFGQSGLLPQSSKEEYVKRIRIEYEFLRDKFSLEPLKPSLWKFLRLRPSNFPTLRIGQFATFLRSSDELLGRMLEGKKPDDWLSWFDVTAGDFWSTHFTFDRISPFQVKRVGQSSSRLLAINTVAPFLFYYGLEKDDTRYTERAVDLLEQLPAEIHSDLSWWEEGRFTAQNSLQSQALLHLRREYCEKKRCLECRIGKRILSNGTPYEAEAVCA